MSTTNSEILPQLRVSCTDAESRALLEDFKSSCRSGWFFETLRCNEKGQMTYKFFLLDLTNQKQIETEQYVRYHGWVEAVEIEGAIAIKPGGALENMLDPELRSFLIKRFYDDIFEPVCNRHRISPLLSL